MTYTSEIRADGLGYAALINAAGVPVLPNVTTVMNAASQFLSKMPADGRIAIAFAPGKDSYPIATFEYVIVKKVQPNLATANALKKFLAWAVSPSGGSSPYFMDKLDLIPLPSQVVSRVVTPLIDQISGRR